MKQGMNVAASPMQAVMPNVGSIPSLSSRIATSLSH